MGECVGCSGSLLVGVWDWIEGYEGKYSVDVQGNVYSHSRGRVRKLRPFDSRKRGPKVHDYQVVDLSVGGKSRKHYVHRLVASTFIPNPEGKPCVNHIDGKPDNNSISNLEWATYSENALHMFRTGLQKKVYGRFNGNQWTGSLRLSQVGVH